MTRRIRGLEVMAGVRETPIERTQKRLVRKAQKFNLERTREIQLIDMIQRRQRGESGLKPMPFAPPESGK